MLEYKNIAEKPTIIRNFTGLPPDALSNLIPAFASAEKRADSARSRAHHRNPGGGRKPVLSTVENRLACFGGRSWNF